MDKSILDSPSDRFNRDFDKIDKMEKKGSITYGNIAEIAELEASGRSRGMSSNEDSPHKSGFDESNG